ncbi:rhomboid family intramembrane serine protease [Nocardioides bizhenqiangii]|uniref:Rhomboid family intramembrane serine protease n=1 Tax=Nocardioides bizhenqiangii TaxID=3095076 RepID=A0ABZ0ZQY3_9ACTN|nr:MULTISPECIES: rhomboid family intramembrane serine protease [unclassified Nocardioides]MDZ5619326.1 rhomboid family intramembrane serine protease [Nocardioides sp. HM23]WQQ26652.1 rhomboid family intramembrane serine protease [Nocardioides sp. HM61]
MSAPAGVPTCYRHPDRETYVRCQRCEKSICPDCMRDAAVGFQCPDCIKEGAKSTRQAQAAYGGRRSSDPRLTSMVLVALNGLVWVAILATGWKSSTLTDRLALLPTGTCRSEGDPGSFYPRLDAEGLCGQIPDGQWFPGVSDGAYWQLVTSMFSHVEIWHIGFNMLVLYFLGPQLEAVLGRARFLALYLVSGLAGSVCVYWFSNEDTSTLGASGAIFGLMGALLVVAFKVRGNVQSIVSWLAINAVVTVVFPGVSWQGHLGGFLGGVLVTVILVYAPKDRRVLLQVAGITLVVVALAAATVARTVALA